VSLSLPQRKGPNPEMRPTLPQRQLDQHAPEPLREQLAARVAKLEGVTVGETYAEPGTRGFHLDPEMAHGPKRDAFLFRTEFAHVHSTEDGGLHVTLPQDAQAEVVAKGWGVQHPMAGQVVRLPESPSEALRAGMQCPRSNTFVFGPRDADELEVVFSLVRHSYDYARGAIRDAPKPKKG
jgi:hypothetical protein